MTKSVVYARVVASAGEASTLAAATGLIGATARRSGYPAFDGIPAPAPPPDTLGWDSPGAYLVRVRGTAPPARRRLRRWHERSVGRRRVPRREACRPPSDLHAHRRGAPRLRGSWARGRAGGAEAGRLRPRPRPSGEGCGSGCADPLERYAGKLVLRAAPAAEPQPVSDATSLAPATAPLPDRTGGATGAALALVLLGAAGRQQAG